MLQFVAAEGARKSLQSDLEDWGPGRFARGKFYKLLIPLWTFFSI